LLDASLASTVFIPSDEAFAAVSAYFGIKLEDLMKDTLKLKLILELHLIVDGALYTYDFVDGMPLGTKVPGKYVTVDYSSGYIGIKASCSDALII